MSIFFLVFFVFVTKSLFKHAFSRVSLVTGLNFSASVCKLSAVKDDIGVFVG